MIRDWLFAERRAGLLEWAVAKGKLEWEYETPEIGRLNLARLWARRDDSEDQARLKATFNIEAKIIPPSGDSLNITIEIKSYTNDVVDEFEVVFAPNGSVVSYGGNRRSDGQQVQAPVSQYLALSSAVSKVFETMGKERGDPKSFLDKIGGERARTDVPLR